MNVEFLDLCSDDLSSSSDSYASDLTLGKKFKICQIFYLNLHITIQNTVFAKKCTFYYSMTSKNEAADQIASARKRTT